MDGAQVTSAIEGGALDGALESIIAAAYRRRGHARYSPAPLAGAAARALGAELSVGRRVAFNGRTRPTYLRGLTGEVTKVNSATVRVALDPGSRAQARRFGGAPDLRVPRSLLEAL